MISISLLSKSQQEPALKQTKSVIILEMQPLIWGMEK
jgi:hypothetical protein